MAKRKPEDKPLPFTKPELEALEEHRSAPLDVNRKGTVHAHVEVILAEMRTRLDELTTAAAAAPALKAKRRAELERTCAGVVAGAETVRLWLSAGAPR